MGEVNMWFLSWMILGLINIGLMFLVQKKRPLALYEHLKYGYIHQLGVMLLWFVFGFVLVPFIVLNTLRKLVGRKLIKLYIKLVIWRAKNKIKKIL